MTRKIRWFAMLVPALFVLAAWPTHAQEKDEDSLIVAEDLLIDDLLSEEAGAEPLEEAERLEEAVEVAPAAEPEPIEPAVEEKGWDVGPEEEPLLPQEEPLVFEEEPLLVEEGPAALEEPAEAEEELPLVEMPVPMEEELPVALPEAPEERMEPEAVPEEIVPEAEVEMAEETIPEAAAEEAEIEDLDTIVEDAFREAAAEGIPEMPAVEALPVLPAPEEEVAETLPGPAPEAAAVPQEIAEMLDREELRRMAEEQHGRESLENANKAYRAGQYARAISLYEQALTYIPDRPDSREVRKEAVRGMAKSYYSQALDLRSRGQLEEAEQMAQAAVAQGHGRAARLVEVIREERTAPPAPPPVEEEGKRWEQKDFREQQEEIADLMSRGRQAMLVGEYDQAQHYFESALKRDPYHAEAMRYMQDILSRKYDQASAELEATRRDMMTGVRKTWNPRDYGVAEETDAAGPPPPPPPPPPGTEWIRKKMQDIVIPEIDFRSANIYDVVKFLHEASVEYDQSDDPPERKGVNIILDLEAGRRGTGAPRGGASEEPFPELIDVDAAGMGEVPLVTFSARYITLMEALNIVTKVAGLKSRIEGKVVMVVPFDAPTDDIIHRMYDVLPTFVARVTELGTEVRETMRGTGGFIELGGAPAVEERADFKEFFREMGVPWPAGSEIKYVPSISKLVVANTAENLTIFERILSVLNVQPRQIEIEARFVEVNQTDLDAIGFEWMLTDDWELASKKGQGSAPLSGRERIVMRANSAAGGFTSGNRFTEDSDLNGGVGFASEVLRVASVLTNPELSMVVHMLAQKGNADLLSAPKVTTQSGIEAQIKVVTEYIYPTQFDVEPITATDDSGTSTIVGGVVEPSAFETREVGVLLSVVPEVSPDGQMINLTMRPEVVSDPEWEEYGSEYTAPDGRVQRLNMRQPFFHTRTVSTTISIYNGATVVMGGMITESKTDVDDRVPLLGDIPLLGRLFRSRYEHSEKRNLLIFVTARLVDPAGRPLSGAGRETDILAGDLADRISNE